MRFGMVLTCACAALVASAACAHGPQIQITVDTANSHKITTRQLLLDEPYSSTLGLTAPAAIYVMPASPVTYLGQAVARVKPSDTSTAGPGFTYGYDQTIGSSRFFSANLNLHAAGLQIWDGTSFIPTGPGKEQIGLLQSSSNVIADTAKTAPGGTYLAIAITPNYTADAHSSVRYTLLGDGVDPYAPSRDGIYLLALQLLPTQSTPSIRPSDPFYFVVGKNAAAGELANVVNAFAASRGIASSFVQYVAAVPESGSLCLIAAGCIGAGLLSCRCSRRHRCGAAT